MLIVVVDKKRREEEISSDEMSLIEGLKTVLDRGTRDIATNEQKSQQWSVCLWPNSTRELNKKLVITEMNTGF